MTLTVRPLHPVFAAEVTGIDLREPPGPDLGREVAAVMDRYAVASLPGQLIDDVQQVRFARLFGDLEVAPLMRGKPWQPAPDARIQYREIFDVSNLDARGNLLPPGDERRN